METFYLLAKWWIIPDQYMTYSFRTTPITELASFLYFCNNLMVLMPICANFFAFYFIIRASYKPISKSEISNVFSDNDVSRYTHKDVSNKNDIEQYLEADKN